MRESSLNREILLLGLSPRHKGFHYFSRVLSRLEGRGGYVGAGEAYRMICRETKEDWRRVERCMRYAIRYAWDVNRGSIHLLFPETDTPPAPIEFIQAVLWHLDK
ncbi:MAG: hypothetical protein J5772_02375 [Clostridia bacterium]|nr:hypothetical protein [Clostridia bacterium]